MAHRLTDKEKKKIIADYVKNGNYNETARVNNVAVNTVKNIVNKKENRSIAQKCIEKRNENTQSTLDYMQNQHETKKRILDKLLKAIEEKSDNVDMFTNIKDLATAYGIIVDKELKCVELKNQTKENENLQKVEELLSKIKEEADR